MSHSHNNGDTLIAALAREVSDQQACIACLVEMERCYVAAIHRHEATIEAVLDSSALIEQQGRNIMMNSYRDRMKRDRDVLAVIRRSLVWARRMGI